MLAVIHQSEVGMSAGTIIMVIISAHDLWSVEQVNSGVAMCSVQTQSSCSIQNISPMMSRVTKYILDAFVMGQEGHVIVHYRM